MNKEITNFKNDNCHWSDNEINYLKENYQKQTYSNISKHLCRTAGAIRAKINDLGLVKKSFWDKTEIDYLLAHYNTMTYKELSNKLNRSEDAIQLKLRKLGYKKTPYHCNYSFFKEINSEQAAYWLGFLYADGYIIINHTTNSGVVGIDLKGSDKHHLELFNQAIDSNYKIIEYEKELNGKKYKMVRTRIYSLEMAQDLIKLGCTERKSKNITFPTLDEVLYPHFIRGYFDGDGCIAKASNKTKQLSIDFTSGSSKFLESLKDFLYSNHLFSYLYHEKNKETYRLYIRGIENIDNFWNYMYQSASVYLIRKFKKKEELYKTCNIAQRLPR